MNSYRDFVNSFSKLGKRVSGLSRIERLMAALGDPQKKFRAVHIAGTNGKGSTAQMLADTLTAAGYRTGLFTSPYIIRYNDRIRIDGREVTDSELDLLAQEVSEAVSGMDEGFSQFEITQAIAFLHYVREGCDIVVTEAGLGGLLDSTNVIPPPECAVITSIAYDHTAILGETLEEIAAQKAGIIKRGSAVVCSASVTGAARDIITARAQECGIQAVIPDMSAVTVRESGIGGTVFDYGEMKGLTLRMGGRHQIYNAAAVTEAVSVLRGRGYDIPESALRRGLEAQIPARVQILSREPLIILDGGHNPEGVAALSAVLSGERRKKCAVIGMLSDKDSSEAARLIAKAADRFVCVDGFAPNARDACELAEILTAAGAPAEGSAFSAEETVRREIRKLKSGEALVICGSLYLAALFADGRIVGEELKQG